MRIYLVLVVAALALIGCNSRGVDRLLYGSTHDEGTPYHPPYGPDADGNVAPLYDQAAATPEQDERLIRETIGTPGTDIFNEYTQSPWLVDRMNGINPIRAGGGTSSVLVDAWKALFRQGYCDSMKLTNPAILRSNRYPIAVYQDTRAGW